MADNKIDSIKINVNGENILETKVDLNKSSEPTIQNIEIKETTESSKLDTTNLSVKTLTAQEIGANQSTTKTLETETTTTNTLKVNKLVGDNLRVKNLFSSETQNQVYTSNGDTTKEGEWKTISIGTKDSGCLLYSNWNSSFLNYYPFHINLSASDYSGGIIIVERIYPIDFLDNFYISIILGTSTIYANDDKDLVDHHVYNALPSGSLFLIDDTFGDSTDKIGAVGGMIEIMTNTVSYPYTYTWCGYLISLQDPESSFYWDTSLHLTPLYTSANSLTILSDLELNFS